MEDDITGILLNGMELNRFLALYGIAVFGSIIIFILEVNVAIKVDKNTPFSWSWRHFLKGFTRIIVTFMIIAMAIIFFKELSPFLFNITDLSDIAPGTEDVVVDVNAFSAVIIGLSMDRIVKGISDKYVYKKVT